VLARIFKLVCTSECLCNHMRMEEKSREEKMLIWGFQETSQATYGSTRLKDEREELGNEQVDGLELPVAK